MASKRIDDGHELRALVQEYLEELSRVYGIRTREPFEEGVRGFFAAGNSSAYDGSRFNKRNAQIRYWAGYDKYKRPQPDACEHELNKLRTMQDQRLLERRVMDGKDHMPYIPILESDAPLIRELIDELKQKEPLAPFEPEPFKLVRRSGAFEALQSLAGPTVAVVPTPEPGLESELEVEPPFTAKGLKSSLWKMFNSLGEHGGRDRSGYHVELGKGLVKIWYGMNKRHEELTKRHYVQLKSWKVNFELVATSPYYVVAFPGHNLHLR